MEVCDTALAQAGWFLGGFSLWALMIYFVFAICVSVYLLLSKIHKRNDEIASKLKKIWLIFTFIVGSSILGIVLAGISGCPISV